MRKPHTRKQAATEARSHRRQANVARKREQRRRGHTPTARSEREQKPHSQRSQQRRNKQSAPSFAEMFGLTDVFAALTRKRAPFAASSYRKAA